MARAPKRPLSPDDRARLALRLDMIADQLAEIETELRSAYAVRSMPVKHVGRAGRAVEASTRALDRL